MDVNLLRVIVVNYHPVTRTIKTYDGKEMVKITKDGLGLVFKLIEWSDEMHKINKDDIRKECDKTKISFKFHILPRFLVEIAG